MHMALRETKLQLIFYASGGPFAAMSVHTLLMSSASLPATINYRNARQWVFFLPDTAIFVMWI
jgi:hypothetical protein